MEKTWLIIYLIYVTFALISECIYIAINENQRDRAHTITISIICWLLWLIIGPITFLAETDITGLTIPAWIENLFVMILILSAAISFGAVIIIALATLFFPVLALLQYFLHCCKIDVHLLP